MPKKTPMPARKSPVDPHEPAPTVSLSYRLAGRVLAGPVDALRCSGWL